MKRVALAAVLSLGLLWPSMSSADAPEAAFEVGFSQRALYRVPIEMVSFAGLIGGQGTHIAYGLPFGVEWGKTLEGLSVLQGRLGFLLEYIAGRVRVGGGTGIGVLTIWRATNANTLGALFADVTVRVSADVFRFGSQRPSGEDEDTARSDTARSALFVASEIRANTAQVWGPSISFGARF